MTSIIPLVAFCASMSAGEHSPVPPFECIWVEDQVNVYTNTTGCLLGTREMLRDDVLTTTARSLVYKEYENVDNVYWYTYCVPLEELPGFYKAFGIDPTDLPVDG